MSLAINECQPHRAVFAGNAAVVLLRGASIAVCTQLLTTMLVQRAIITVSPAKMIQFANSITPNDGNEYGGSSCSVTHYACSVVIEPAKLLIIRPLRLGRSLQRWV